ncbi:MAG: aminopeptidase N [Parvularculaceae bacterium]
MTDTEKPKIFLKDYRAPDYLVDTAHLEFNLDRERTVVKSTLAMRRAETADADAAVRLDGEEIELCALLIDGEQVSDQRFKIQSTVLEIFDAPERFVLEITTACSPARNTALSGLYISNDMFCTQCEAEGFRRITYYPDRPDILARFSVRIVADQNAFPVLLSNGDLVNEGGLDAGRHFAEWRDPHPKPSYLFALVGGDLVAVEDKLTTRSGRDVRLQVFVQDKNKDKCAYTLDSLKRAMKWDEDTFGREYDLDRFMIVAVDHFNFGAMENKGLNIFNSAYVLASPETATDADYEVIESIVAHEYFHNWSGNRVTCRDWFQLCLKEGFTVFRDQEFSADMRSRPVQRIKDVRRLWSRQFPEDAGPLAHPVRPESFVEIDNFYTATVYEKGAELCRMIRTLLGGEKFRAGSDLYFSRHDGAAATVEDFVTAMADASGYDLTQFLRWYSDAGAPRLTVSIGELGGETIMRLSQRTQPTPGQHEKPPRLIPVSYAVIGAESGLIHDQGLAVLRDESADIALGKYGERVIASVLRGFSAPVTVEYDLSADDRLSILRHETDAFSRWAICNQFWKELCLAHAAAIDFASPQRLLEKFADALRPGLRSAEDDPAFAAELLYAPSESDLSNQVEVWDPDIIRTARAAVRRELARLLQDDLKSLYLKLDDAGPFSPAADAAARRTLKNATLGLLVAGGDTSLAIEQARRAAHMTDEAAATAALAMTEGPERRSALDRFYDRWRHNALVVNKWLSWSALAPPATALDEVRALMRHEAFDLKTPNRVRALIGGFAMNNPAGFHRADGAGYAFFADQVVMIDRINPQLAARLMTALEAWRRLEPGRRALAQNAVKRIASGPNLSANVSEMAARLLDA